MLALLPVLALMVTAVVVFAWQRLRAGFGIPWLIALSVALIVWIGILVMGLRLPLELELQQWLVIGETAGFPSFRLDEISWPYAFALAGLLLAMILTASARLIHGANPRAWAGGLMIGAVGLQALMAGNPLTLLLAWSLMDLAELTLLMATAAEARQRSRVVLSFAARVGSLLALIWAMLAARAVGVTLSFSQIAPQASLALLLAAALRLGVVPLHLPYIGDVPMRRGLGTLLRLVPPASSLTLLARLPVGAITESWGSLLLVLAGLAALVGGLLWVFSNDALQGRPYWLVALAGFSVASVLRGNPQASVAWGCAMLLAGGLLFFYSVHERGVYILPVLGFIGVSGLPFTPAAMGWAGVWTAPFNTLNVVFVFSHAALLIGYLQLAFQPGDRFAQMDNWVRGVYSSGLFFLVITHWVITFFSLPASFTLASLLPALISTLVALSVLAIRSRAPRVGENAQQSWLGVLWQRAWRALVTILRLEWFYTLTASLYSAGRWLIAMLTNILEGDAGVLWALVLLLLLISLLGVGGGQ